MSKNIFCFIGGMVAGIAMTLFTASLIPLDESPEPDNLRQDFR